MRWTWLLHTSRAEGVVVDADSQLDRYGVFEGLHGGGEGALVSDGGNVDGHPGLVHGCQHRLIDAFKAGPWDGARWLQYVIHDRV